VAAPRHRSREASEARCRSGTDRAEGWDGAGPEAFDVGSQVWLVVEPGPGNTRFAGDGPEGDHGADGVQPPQDGGRAAHRRAAATMRWELSAGIRGLRALVLAAVQLADHAVEVVGDLLAQLWALSINVMVRVRCSPSRSS
jgi:hypothetical protein